MAEQAKAKEPIEELREEQAEVAHAQQEAGRVDETIVGGRYYMPDGKTLINAHGQKIDKNGKVLDDRPVLLI